MNNEVNSREIFNDSTTKKEKKWTYLVFFLMGIISFPIGYILTLSVRSMINLEGIWQLLFPLLIFLVFFAIGLAAFKKQPQAYYSLKAFVACFAGMFFILVLVFWPNSFLSLLVFFGPQRDASTSTSISVESSAENFTIYVPVLLDENKNVLKMYENPIIAGRATTSLIDTEHGKALKISKSGLGNYVFNWNEVPGKDNDRFVKWIEKDGYTIIEKDIKKIYILRFVKWIEKDGYTIIEKDIKKIYILRFVKWIENGGYTQPGEKLDITKTDNGTTLTVFGSITPSGRNNLIIRLNEKNILKFYNIYDSETSGGGKVGYYPFNWTEVPGKDTDPFVRWMEGEGFVQPGEKLEISKTDNGRAITVSGKGTWIYRLNDNGDLEFHGVKKNIEQEYGWHGSFFAKEENGNLNIYSGNNEISMNESHEKLKEDEQTSDEFFRQFTISMSNYSSPGSFVNPSQYPESSPRIDAWVYSDTEIEKIHFYYHLDPENRNDRIVLSIGTDGWIHLKKGWQLVNLSRGISYYD